MAADPRQMPDEEAKAYWALRHIWKRLDELTPDEGIPWRKWWEREFGKGRTVEQAATDYGRRQ